MFSRFHRRTALAVLQDTEPSATARLRAGACEKSNVESERARARQRPRLREVNNWLARCQSCPVPSTSNFFPPERSAAGVGHQPRASRAAHAVGVLAAAPALRRWREGRTARELPPALTRASGLRFNSPREARKTTQRSSKVTKASLVGNGTRRAAKRAPNRLSTTL